MITALYAGILGLIYIALSFFVIKGRFKHRISLGDGGNDDLQKRIRIHANFAEYIPFALILIILAEFTGVADMLIHILGGALVLGRLMHLYGILTKEGSSIGRAGGMMITFLVILTASVICILSSF